MFSPGRRIFHDVGAVAASPSLSLVYVVGGDNGGLGSESWAVAGEMPLPTSTSPSLTTLLELMSTYMTCTCTLPQQFSCSRVNISAQCGSVGWALSCKVRGYLIPGQGTGLSCGFGSQLGHM